MFLKDIPDFYFLPLGQNPRQFPVVHYKLEKDISELFPYLNSVIDEAEYLENPEFIKFKYKGYGCALYPDHIRCTPVYNEEEAKEIIKIIFELLNDIYNKRDSIKPYYKKKKYTPVIEILKLLPGTNCKKCGFPTCMAFAVEINNGKTGPEMCPDINFPITESAVYPIYDDNGELVSTVSIETDHKKKKGEIKKQKSYVNNIEKKITQLTKEKTVSDNEENKFNLTEREKEVLAYVAEGLSNTEIANLLNISAHTVKGHVINVFNKIGVNDRTQASVWAVRHNII